MPAILGLKRAFRGFHRSASRLHRSAQLNIETALPGWVEERIVQHARGAKRRSEAPEGSTRKRLFVDVSVVAVNDAGTGIQRVVRGISNHLKNFASERWDIRFVAAHGAQPYHQIAPSAEVDIDSVMEARPGDVFLGLDYSLDAIAHHKQQLARFRQNGGAMWFLIHDLLPLHRPDWFSKQTALRYRKWLRILASLADGFFCNSTQTETELVDALASRFGLRGGYRTCVLPMGADIPLVERANASIGGSGDLTGKLTSLPFVLMVGTLEPRKGHDQVLSAFEQLWDSQEVALVLVGRPGWKVEPLQERLTSHPLLGTKLFWLNDASDSTLIELYKRCEGVIIAALAEGFGLPLIEALGYRKPVLARDLPIFRQHEHSGVRFFPADATVEQLTHSTGHWLQDVQAGRIRVSPPELSWSHTTEALVAALDPK